MSSPSPTVMCQYKNPEGFGCALPAERDGLCCWHDDHVEKKGEEWRGRLQALANSGVSMSGFKLRRVNLAAIDLVNHHHKQGFDLSYADLYRANLQDAHLFKLNLKGASLMKANLDNANLHYADLQGANLLGASMRGSKIEHVSWGDRVLQESEAHAALRKGDAAFATALFEESEEIYRNIRKVAEEQGLFGLAGTFFYREMVARRMQMAKWSVRRLLSATVDLLCGYGEKPLNVILSSAALVAGCALLYWLLGVSDGARLISVFNAQSGTEAFTDLLQCLYYSVVTFTTLGYGDIAPVGVSRAVAALEAFTGSFAIALFVVVFVKKMIR